jgi:hypothetical protein
MQHPKAVAFQLENYFCARRGSQLTHDCAQRLPLLVDAERRFAMLRGGARSAGGKDSAIG